MNSGELRCPDSALLRYSWRFDSATLAATKVELPFFVRPGLLGRVTFFPFLLWTTVFTANAKKLIMRTSAWSADPSGMIHSQQSLIMKTMLTVKSVAAAKAHIATLGTAASVTVSSGFMPTFILVSKTIRTTTREILPAYNVFVNSMSRIRSNVPNATNWLTATTAGACVANASASASKTNLFLRRKRTALCPDSFLEECDWLSRCQ